MADTNQVEYQAGVTSSLLNEQAKLTITPDGVTLAALFSSAFIDFTDVVAIQRQGYEVVVTTATDRFVLSGIGNPLDGFMVELRDAFNARVRAALAVKGNPSAFAEGDFAYSEPGFQASGRAIVEVYDDCLTLLPPDDRARRIPFAFMTGLQPAQFGCTVVLDDGSQYSVTHLGNATDVFVNTLKTKLQALREHAIDAARELDGGLDASQLSAIAALMRNGVAAPMGRLTEIAPSFAAAVEAAIAATRAADTYTVLKGLCPPGAIYVGLKKGLAGEQRDGAGKDVLWFVAPSATKPMAAVELAVDDDTAAATFVYAMGDDRGAFCRSVNKAMEANDFRREVISLPDDQLHAAEHGVYHMAVHRTPALRWLRGQLAARVIHSSMDSWTSGIQGYLG